MSSEPSHWSLLVVSLPTKSATARMRVWRSLKTLGCGALRDGAYLLPGSDEARRQFEQLALDARKEGGVAWLLTVAAQSPAEEKAYRALFDRSRDYAAFSQALAEQRDDIARLAPPDLARLLRKLQREIDSLHAIDYFPGKASADAAVAWRAFAAAAEARLSPHEPSASAAPLARLDAADYQGRRWATRRRLWVDRVASAWLVRRFIDPLAAFVWLDSPADCPPDALGFDFDGAAFTHVGELVTFEVLLASFAIDEPGMARLAAMVHALDVGGAFVPEARGFEAMLGGARQNAADDDALLAAMTPVLDALLIHFSTDAATPPPAP